MAAAVIGMITVTIGAISELASWLWPQASVRIRVTVGFGAALLIVVGFLVATRAASDSASATGGSSNGNITPPAPTITATHPAGTAPAADPLTVVRTYFRDLSRPQDLAAAWSLLSPAEQNSLGGYAQWSASRSNIALETATYLSGSGDQVTVALHQVRYDAPPTDATATFTVDGGVITAVG
jgi:hypothetical protein